MQSVADRWYIRYKHIATAISLLIVGGCFLIWLIPGLHQFGQEWSLNHVTFALASMLIAYSAFLYSHEAERAGYWLATLILSMILTLNVINLIHTTGMLSSWYMLLWALVVLGSGMFGMYGVIGVGFMMTFYFILVTTDGSGFTSFSSESLVGVVGTYVLGIISYFSWRPQYIKQESLQVAKLTGALKNKQQQAEILIQSITDGIIVTDVEGKVSLINPAAAKLTQWNVDEAVGIDANLVLNLHSEKGENIGPSQNPFKLTLQNKQEVKENFTIIGRDGTKHIVSLAVSPIITAQKESVGAVAVFRDISASRAEEQRRADFISTASHEMRTPVAAIEGYLALALNDKVSKIDSKARSYLERAHSSTQQLGKLFQDLLTSAKAEDGRLVSHPIVVEMGDYLEQLSDSLRFSAEKKGLLMEFVLGTAQHVQDSTAGNKVIKPLYYVHVDPDRLREVVTNIFDNAVKYTESGKISIGLTGNTEVVQLYVKDTGPGIPASDVPHLFQKFYRVDNSATRTIGGTGLGLFICRKIVELYNGRIWVESKPNQGSIFYINLPRLSTQKATELMKEEAAQQSALQMA